MSRDYKFLSNRPKGEQARSWPRPSKHHLVAAAGVVATLLVIVGLLPHQASAVRKEAQTSQAIPDSAELSQRITESLALPKDVAAAAAPMPDKAVPVTPKAAATQEGTWKEITVRSGDSLARIFSKLDLSAADLHEIVRLGNGASHLKNLYPGEKVRFRIGADHKLLELVHEMDAVRSLHVIRTDNGFKAEQIERKVETRIAHAAGTISDSLFVAAQNSGLPDNLTMQLATIFGWDIDFALDIREGDHFTVLYQENYLQGKKISEGDIIAAEFTNRGKTYRAVRYTDSGGHTDYYSPDGLSLRKAFLRTPVKFTRISSRFTLHRRHPILKRVRPHEGVDYAAPRGTPIRATGDGRITFRGRKGGYGRTIVINHGHSYSTLYAHMSAFNRKLRTGSRVRQGQVIGYVGASGLATGPHLHYEFRINGVHRNPLTVKLPMATPIAKRYLDDFRRQAAPLSAQLDLLTRSLLARN